MDTISLHEKTIGEQHFTYVNSEEFLYTYQATFYLGFYRFRAETKEPFIIDCGAHIGISILYFKKLYPQARILGFEANPETFKLLQQNIVQNHLNRVEVVQAAVSNEEGTIAFYIGKDTSGELSQWGDAGIQNKWNTPENYTKIVVPALCLSSYITQKVDFLKLNIEGMEGIVLREIEPKLHLVKNIRIEYHGSSTNQENKLEDILALLRRNGFRYVLEQDRKIVGVTQIKRSDPYLLNIYTYTQIFPWWWHRYACYLPSHGRALIRFMRRKLGEKFRSLGIKH